MAKPVFNKPVFDQPKFHNEARHFGVHLIVDGYNGSAERLQNKVFLNSFLDYLPIHMGMQKLAEPMVREVGGQQLNEQYSLSGYLLFEESHICLHTFPRRGFLSADVYSCKQGLDTEMIISVLRAGFVLQYIDTQHVRRGLSCPEQNIEQATNNVSISRFIAGVQNGC